MKITFINMFKNRHKAKHNKKKIMSKNQVALFAISLMLISASYMNQANNMRAEDLGDAKLVSTKAVENNEIIEVKEEVAENEIVETGSTNIYKNEVIETVKVQKDNYFTKTRLDRETMFSQMLESYTKILQDEKISNDQKSIASNEIKVINDRKNQISIIENLFKTKNFDDVVVLINDNSVNVIVKQEKELSEEQVAMLLHIVSRELNMDIHNIHITNKG